MDHLLFLGFLLIQAAAANGQSSPNSSCSKGWPGSDSGGSCTFRRGSFCDWTSENNANETLRWTPYHGKGMHVDTEWSGTRRATLRSPVLCERDDLCLTFRYSFSIAKYGKLSVDAVFQTDNNSTKLFDKKREDWSWHTKSINFTASKSFRIVFTGAKTYDGIGPESDIILDYVKFEHGYCGTKPVAPSTTEETHTVKTTGGTSTSAHRFSTSSDRSGDPDNVSDWTTLSTPLSTTLTSTGPEAKAGSKDGEDTDEEEAEGESDHQNIILIVAILVGLIVVIGATVIIVIFVRRRKQKRHIHGENGSQEGATLYNRNDSLVMVTNDLYYTTQDVTGPAPRDVENDSQPLPLTTPATTAATTGDVYSIVVKDTPSSTKTTRNTTANNNSNSSSNNDYDEPKSPTAAKEDRRLTGAAAATTHAAVAVDRTEEGHVRDQHAKKGEVSNYENVEADKYSCLNVRGSTAAAAAGREKKQVADDTYDHADTKDGRVQDQTAKKGEVAGGAMATGSPVSAVVGSSSSSSNYEQVEGDEYSCLNVRGSTAAVAREKKQVADDTYDHANAKDG